jgi:hypothetical protein
LPAIDRRSLVCGLGTAAVAGVPALGIAAPTSDDPVFQAMASLEQLKIHVEEPDAAHSVAEDVCLAAWKENIMTIDGEEMRTHEQIDDHFMPAFKDEEQFNNFVERLRPRHLSEAERAERDLARQLTTNCPGRKRKLPKSNSARDIEKSSRKRTPPTPLFGTPNTKSWKPSQRHRRALLLCCASLRT